MVTFLRAKDVGPDPIIAMRIILFFLERVERLEFPGLINRSIDLL